MTQESKGPVQARIEKRLVEALNPVSLAVINDSDKHRGHAGHDGRGESHFTVEITSTAFAGKGRVDRQRMVNRALGDLMDGTVHALAIKANAPDE